MAETFQPDFYLACATVIPVLFLAFAVQRKAFAWLLGFIKLLRSVRDFARKEWPFGQFG